MKIPVNPIDRCIRGSYGKLAVSLYINGKEILPAPDKISFRVGVPGLEPGKAGPESAVLPLHHTPNKMNVCHPDKRTKKKKKMSWGTRTRTRKGRTRICSVTITPYPKLSGFPKHPLGNTAAKVGLLNKRANFFGTFLQ